MLTTLGALSSAFPLPWVPSRLVTSVRGAIVFDVARQHGLSLTADARQVLSSADSSDPQRSKYIGFASWAVGRLLRYAGPLRLLNPCVSAIETFAMGHLLDRYFEEARIRSSVRIEADEALHIRNLISRSLRMTLAMDLVVPKESRPDQPPGDEQRDDTTRMMDWALLSTASFPSFLLRRLDASFDRVVLDLKNSAAV